MKILVTGISGFVARHFLDYLSSTGDQHSVAGVYFHNKPSFGESDFENVSCTFHQVDLKNREQVSRLLSSFQPQFILHLAAKSSVAYSWLFPADAITENNTMFLNIIEEMRVLKLKCRLLSVGSSEEYGNVEEAALPLRESQPANPVNPYGASRVFQQMLIDIYCKNYGLDIIHTRSFNHLGPYQTKDFVVSSFTRQVASQLAKETNPIVLNVGNVDVVRDFTDVRDVVEAYYKLLLQGQSGQIYNVCSGKSYAIKDVIKMIESIIGRKIEWAVAKDNVRPAENKKIIGSYQKLAKATGWAPKISMEQSLSDLIHYWSQKPAGLLLL